MSFQTVVFPGQGSQRTGMALDFVQQYADANATFESATKVLPFDVKAVCHTEDPRLNMTEYTQPCILTTEIAMFRALRNNFGFDPQYFGGHSLGEYAALVAADVIPFEAAVNIVHERGKLMQAAVPVGVGTMSAVIMENLPYNDVNDIAAQRLVDIANDNSPNQVVISGKTESVAEVGRTLETKYQEQGIRVVPLSVSAPFHSRHMSEIEQKFTDVLERYRDQINTAKLNRVTSNYTGGFHTPTADALFNALTKQLSGRVRWRDNMSVLKEAAEGIVEVGPHRPIKSFFKTLGVSVESVMDLRSANKVFSPEQTS